MKVLIKTTPIRVKYGINMSLRIRNILPILFILFTAFLRFYRFEEFVTFLGDQGRDAIIVKRIITLEHLPAIGPPSSLGQIYLGPFYYYLISPFLLFFNFNPVGLAFGVALLSLAGIIISYLLVRKELDRVVALIYLIFLSFSAVNIQSSRFSWNPNLLPIFSFFTLYFFYKVLTSKNKLNAVAFGAFLSFSIQLHHLAFLLFLPLTVISIYLRLNKKGLNFLIAAFSFLLFSLPLIIFDLRHDFLNTKSLFQFFSQGNPTDHENFLFRFLDTNKSFYSHVFQTDLNQYLALFLTVFLVFFIIKKGLSPKYLFISIHLLSLVFFILAFSFFNASRFAHYFGPIYFSFFLVFAWTITNITKKGLVSFFLIFMLILFYVSFNLKNLMYLFYTRGNNQIKKAEIIADSILQKDPQIPYQTVALPYVETDGHIRYFLEIKDKRPLPADTLNIPKELYVFCFEKECQVLGNPQWQIAAFKNAKIDKIWTVEGVKIYKLIHIND